MARLFYSLAVAAFLVSTPAFAEPTKLSTHGDWTVYTMTDAGANVCFMASKPTKTDGLSATARRGDVFALVTHRSDEPSPYVFSFQTGYTYQTGSDVTLKIDAQNFALFTDKETAWAKTADMDSEIAAAIRKGSKMQVTGTSSRGTTTTDHISLKGTGAAFQAMAKACRIGG